MNGAICGDTRRVYRRRILHCSNCGRNRRVVECWGGLWYSPIFRCVACGDAWSDGEWLPRPFRRGWRQEAIARARQMWDEAISAGAYANFIHDELRRELEVTG